MDDSTASRPVMPRWMTSSHPDSLESSRSTIRYLPRRRTPVTSQPTASIAGVNFADGWAPASVIERPSSRGCN